MEYNISQQEAKVRITIKRALRKTCIRYDDTAPTNYLLDKLGCLVYQMPQGDWGLVLGVKSQTAFHREKMLFTGHVK